MSVAAASVSLILTILVWKLDVDHPGLAILAWLAAIGLLVALSLPRVRSRVPTDDDVAIPALSHRQLLLLVLLLLAGGALRIAGLLAIPPYIDADEGRQGIYAAESIFQPLDLDGTVPHLFRTGWNSLPNLAFVLLGAFFKPFGVSFEALRLSSAVWGTLTLLFFFLFARELWGNRTALIGLAFAVAGRNHVEWSRIGTCNVQSGLLGMLSLYFVARALRTQRLTNWVLAGVSCGLGMHVYHASKAVPFILAAFFGLMFLTRRDLALRSGKGMLFFTMAFVATFGPLALWMAENWKDVAHGLDDRTLQDDVLRLFEAGKYQEILRLLQSQTWSTFLGILFKPGSFPFAYAGPMVDGFTGTVAAAGLFEACRRAREPRMSLVLLWFILTLFLGSVMAINPPHHPRLIGVFLCLYLLAGIGCEAIVRTAERSQVRWALWTGRALVGAVLAAAVAFNIKNYFFDFPRAHERDARSELALLLEGMKVPVTVLVAGKGPDLDWFDSIIQFAARRMRCDGENFETVKEALAFPRKDNRRRLIAVTTSVPDAVEQVRRVQGAVKIASAPYGSPDKALRLEVYSIVP